jgi:hypothetical protein
MIIRSCSVLLNSGSAQLSLILLKSLPLNQKYKITHVSDVALEHLVLLGFGGFDDSSFPLKENYEHVRLVKMQLVLHGLHL